MATLSPLTNSSPAICRELSEKTDAEVLQRKELHQDKTNEEALHNVLPLSQMSSTEDVELGNLPTSNESHKDEETTDKNFKHLANVATLVVFARRWLLSTKSPEELEERRQSEQKHLANVASVFQLQTSARDHPNGEITGKFCAENAAHSTETPNGNTNNVSNNTNNNTANVTNSQNDTQPALPNNANASNEVARAEERRPRTPLIVRLKKLLQIIKTAPFETIDSSHSPYYYWSFVVYIAFLYNALMCVMFVFDNMQGSFFTFWFCCNMFFDFVYLLDIFINSKLNLMEEGMVIRSWKRLAKRYMRSWRFVLDVASVLPSDIFLIFNKNASLVRANRLLKIHRVMDFVERTNIRTNYPNGFRIFHIVVTCAVIFHLNAALYFKISLMRGVEKDERCGLNETGLDPDDRMSYLSKLTTYWSTRSTKMRFSNFTKQYSLSFYWSSLTLTTSGQQPYPTQDIHNYLEIVDTVVGVLVFAVIVGSVGNVVVTMNRDRAQVQGLTDGIKFYMNYRNVSPDIQKRVIEFISYIEKYGLFCDESEILDSIPRRLQGELALHLHMETLKNVELFRDCDPSILYELVLRLTMHIYGPNDYLCRAGDVAKEMFIVKTGVLESISEHGLKISVLKEGSTFGELSLLRVANSTRSNRRIRSLRSIGYSDIYQLKQEDLLEVLKDYPEARNKLIQRAREMTRRRGATDPQAQDLNDPNQEIEGVHNVEETLSLLADSVKKIEDELNSLYFDFHDASSNNKRRMTRLETIYKQTKPQFQFYPHR